MKFKYTTVSLMVLILLGASDSHAQRWSWPEKPENLQVLPKDWPGSRLRPVMTGFTRTLGVRCSYCHVGEEGQPLSTYNFASDENPKKTIAREMLRMLGSINDHLDKIEPSGPQRVNMWCGTCHSGRPKPMTLHEKLMETYTMADADSAVASYHILKVKYYGRGAYDFGERSLTVFGYEILGKEDYKGAIAAFILYTQEYPDSFNSWDSLAEGYMKAGEVDRARENYQKSLQLNPDNQNAKDMILQLDEEE